MILLLIFRCRKKKTLNILFCIFSGTCIRMYLILYHCAIREKILYCYFFIISLNNLKLYERIRHFHTKVTLLNRQNLFNFAR